MRADSDLPRDADKEFVEVDVAFVGVLVVVMGQEVVVEPGETFLIESLYEVGPGQDVLDIYRATDGELVREAGLGVGSKHGTVQDDAGVGLVHLLSVTDEVIDGDLSSGQGQGQEDETPGYPHARAALCRHEKYQYFL